MNHDKEALQRIQELEDQLDDALITVDSLYEELDRKNTRIKVLEGVLAQIRTDRKVELNV